MSAFALVTLIQLHLAASDVIYQVFPVAMNPTCDETAHSKPGNTISTASSVSQVGQCHDFGMGKSAYNAIEILGCSKACLCFKQYASNQADAGCNATRSLGANVKESCFNSCLQDCNGPNCGATATESETKLKLVGSGTICEQEVPEDQYSCETTGMMTRYYDTTTTGGGANEAAYVIGTAAGNDCPVGYTNILDKTTCQTAASSLGLQDKTQTNTVEEYGLADVRPKGCFIYVGENTGLSIAYFNPNEGTPSNPSDLASPICAQGGTPTPASPTPAPTPAPIAATTAAPDTETSSCPGNTAPCLVLAAAMVVMVGKQWNL